MSKPWQIYFNALMGAIGGLIAWMVVGAVPTGEWNVHAANAFAGLGIGMLVGAFIGSVEGAVVKRSLRQALVGTLFGALAGSISGVLGLLIGGVAFLVIGGGLIGTGIGGLIARMVGWMALGFFLGLGQGLVSMRFKRASYSMIGGTLAGLVGGLLYELLTQMVLSATGDTATWQPVLTSLGLSLIGASLGSIIATTVELGKDGLVVVLNGPRANMEVSIIGAATLGSLDACDVYLPDPQVEKNQAVITKNSQGFFIKNTGARQIFTVGRRPVAPNESQKLNNGDELLFGSTQVRFRAK